MLELAAVVRELTGSDSPIAFEPLPQDDPRQRRPDISLAERLLGWRPKVALYAGLATTIAHLREEMERAPEPAASERPLRRVHAPRRSPEPSRPGLRSGALLPSARHGGRSAET